MSTTDARLVVGARSSRLSQAQTRIVLDLLRKTSPGIILEVSLIKTRGDRLPPERRTATKEGKRAFTSELEKMLLGGKIDIAVHSMKDLTSVLESGLVVGATPPREDPRDALMSGNNGDTISTLAKGARIGTSSLRRRAQLLRLRSDLNVVLLHGNVNTRIEKIGSDLDAVVLAVAGLKRIGEEGRISQIFSVDEMVPAVGQGIIAVEMRKDDTRVSRIISRIDDDEAGAESVCERAFLERLGGDCYVPVGACSHASVDEIAVTGMIASPDGRDMVKKTLRSGRREASSLGRRLAVELLSNGGDMILKDGAASS
jgi:hydroxymethylbilane synthase